MKPKNLRANALCAVCAVVLGYVSSLHAQQADVILPALGGPGGGQFLAHCGPDELLTGLDLRTGDDVDAIKPICVSAVGGHVREFPNMFGGPGGGPRQLFCPPYTPVVTGMYIGSEGRQTEIVNNIHLFCGINADTQTASQYPAAIFDGPEIGRHGGAFGAAREATQRCPDSLVGVGINGRAGKWLDAVGLVCGLAILPTPPAQPSKPPVSLGKKAHSSPSVTPITGRASRAADIANVTVGMTPAPPPAAPPAPWKVGSYAPPIFADGAQLWTCANAVQAEKKAGVCNGILAGKAFCKAHGHSGSLQPGAGGAPALTVARAAAEARVHAVNGDACGDGNCVVITTLACDP